MSELLALSFDAPASPAVSMLRKEQDASQAGARPEALGWGMAWYPGEEWVAQAIKDPTSKGDDPMSAMLSGWNRFRSTIFLCHIHGAAKRRTQRDTHPFLRAHGRHTWSFAHNGDLEGDLNQLLPLGERPLFEPLGRTDSEHAFCWLLNQAAHIGARGIREFGYARLYECLRQLNGLGTANFLLSDGEDLVVYRDQNEFNELHWIRRVPPHVRDRLEGDSIAIEMNASFDQFRTSLVFASHPLSPESWVAMSPGQMLVARRAAIVWDNLAVWDQTPRGRVQEHTAVSGATQQQAPMQQAMSKDTSGSFDHAIGTLLAPADAKPHADVHELGANARTTRISSGVQSEGRMLRVRHDTTYEYQQAVEHSAHVFRLRPVHDFRQELIQHSMTISVAGEQHEFEDVFGNFATDYLISDPYTQLTIQSESVVWLRAGATGGVVVPDAVAQIPLVWMPWQRQMMLPYLLPPELPESELRELNEFALAFVRRNDSDLMDTLLDMTETIFRDFRYVPGMTNLETTPFDVYVHRKGVCQDFANLLICLARLLNVPARYRTGYIRTGADYENTYQSDASHAWAELYLPRIGWRGFDPTNGVMPDQDHIRVACGRNFRDSTPTMGTIYRGGGGEVLSTNVRVTVEA